MYANCHFVSFVSKYIISVFSLNDLIIYRVVPCVQRSCAKVYRHSSRIAWYDYTHIINRSNYSQCIECLLVRCEQEPEPHWLWGPGPWDRWGGAWILQWILHLSGRWWMTEAERIQNSIWSSQWHVCKLVPLHWEQGGKTFARQLLACPYHAACGEDQGCKAPTFDFTDTLIILSPLHFLSIDLYCVINICVVIVWLLDSWLPPRGITCHVTYTDVICRGELSSGTRWRVTVQKLIGQNASELESNRMYVTPLPLQMAAGSELGT